MTATTKGLTPSFATSPSFYVHMYIRERDEKEHKRTRRFDHHIPGLSHSKGLRPIDSTLEIVYILDTTGLGLACSHMHSALVFCARSNWLASSLKENDAHTKLCLNQTFLYLAMEENISSPPDSFFNEASIIFHSSNSGA